MRKYYLACLLIIILQSCDTQWAKSMYKHRGNYTRVYDDKNNRYYDSAGWHHKERTTTTGAVLPVAKQ